MDNRKKQSACKSSHSSTPQRLLMTNPAHLEHHPGTPGASRHTWSIIPAHLEHPGTPGASRHTWSISAHLEHPGTHVEHPSTPGASRHTWSIPAHVEH